VSDVFNVTAAWNAASYTPGQTMVAAISGGDVQSTNTSTTTTVGPVSIPIVAADGAKSTVSAPAVQITTTSQVATPESVVIDTTVPIVDNSPTPHVWTVAPNLLSISAVA
jgi:hypothetical protein